MKFLFLIMMIFSAGLTAHAEIPDGFTVYEITPQRYMFENAKTSTTVIVNFEPVPVDSADVSAYISSYRYIQDAKNARKSTSLGFETDEPFSFHAGRDHIGSVSIGVNEYEFFANDKSALVTERWYVRDGWSFNILISSFGTQTPSPDDHKAIFDKFTDDLGLSQTVASFWKLAVSRSEAAELGQTTDRKRMHTATPTAQSAEVKKPALTCEAQAADLGISPQDVRKTKGNAQLHFGTECLAGAKQVLTDMKSEILGAGRAIANATSSAASAVSQRYAANEDYISRQIGCRGGASSAPPHRQPPRAVRASQSSLQSWSDWVTQSQIWKSTTAMAKQASCAVASNVGAAVMTDAQYQKQAWDYGVKVAKAGGQLALRAGAAMAYYNTPQGQVELAKGAIDMVKSAPSGISAMLSFASKHKRGWDCMSDAAQTRFVCQMVTIVVREGVIMAATGGAVNAAMKAARAGRALAEAVEAVEVGTRAEQKAAALRYANAAARAGGRSNLKAAERVLGRQLSKAELAAIEEAHLAGVNGAGQYTKAELLSKIRILKNAGIGPEERNLLMRVGITGQPPPALAAVLAADAGGETAVKSSSFGEQRSIANEILGAREDHPASFYRVQAATLEKDSTVALQEAKTTPIGLRSNVTQSRMHEMARAEMRAISPADISKTEFISDGNYLKMIKLSSHVDSQTASEAGEVVGRVIHALPAEKRAEFLESFNIQMTSANKAAKEAADAAAADRSALARATTEREREEFLSRGESRAHAAAKEELKFGSNYSATVNSVYQNVVRSGMGLNGTENSTKFTELMSRLNSRSPATVDAAIKEVLAAPGMQGIPAQEFRDLRSTAAAASAIKSEAEKAASASARLEISRQPALNAARRQGPDAVHKLRVQWAAEDSASPANNGLRPTLIRDLKPFGQ